MKHYTIERQTCCDCGVVFIYRRKGHKRERCLECAIHNKWSKLYDREYALRSPC